MKRNLIIGTAAALAALGCLPAAAVNITIFDGQGYNGSTYTSTVIPGQADGNYFTGAGNPGAVGTKTRANPGSYFADEDQETEPGNFNIVASQGWDLEAFIMAGGKNIQLVGGYNFQNGNAGLYSGDIFIDVNGDAIYGPPAVSLDDGSGTRVTSDLYGYDYVISFDRTGKVLLNTYDVYKLVAGASLLEVSIDANNESNPWKLNSAGSGNEIAGYQNQSFTIDTGKTDAEVGFLGGSHNILNFNLDFLTDEEFANATLHFTIECGNDNIMGRVQVPDGGATLVLLGMGLTGAYFMRRRLS